jgi:hypothetical protein
VTFLTAQGNPPILAGDGTSFTGDTYTAAYTITGGSQLTGFNFVVSGYVYELGQIIWTKKVVDINTSQILYNGSGVFSGSGYQGGSDGNVNFSSFIPLARPSANVQVTRPSSCISMARPRRVPRSPRYCKWSRTGYPSLQACSR